MSRYFIHLAFDGSKYCGWQIQPGVTTVQETLEKAVRVLYPDVEGVVGCGRTDTGVHASMFYVHFETSQPFNEQTVYKFNAILPMDIAVKEVFPVDEKLHARFSATERTYRYFIHFSKNPFVNQFSVYHSAPLDVDAMNRACRHLIGRHDFSSFSRSQTQVKTNMCNVTEAFWETAPNGVVFQITANRFLRNMVRAVVGTCLPIGEGRQDPELMVDVISAQNREAAGKSVHPQGLFLTSIKYPFSDVAHNG